MNPLERIRQFLKHPRKTADVDRQTAGMPEFAQVFGAFQKILTLNNQALGLIAEMGDKLSGDYVFDINYILSACNAASELIEELIVNLNALSPGKYPDLFDAFHRINTSVKKELEGSPKIPRSEYTLSFEQMDRDSEDISGSKNANLTEIKNVLGLTTPEGFAITARAFDTFMGENRLWDQVNKILEALHREDLSSQTASDTIRDLIMKGKLPEDVETSMSLSLDQLKAFYKAKEHNRPLRLAVRSSAWREDSNDSFAGQYASLLNWNPEKLPDAYKRVLASAYSSSAIEYRRQRGFSLTDVVMGVSCQSMVEAKVSGVLYTVDPLDPRSGRMLVSAAWGLGAPIVAGTMAADRYSISRQVPHDLQSISIAVKKEHLSARHDEGIECLPVSPELWEANSLTPEQAEKLADAALMIERHFKSPQDIEFAFDLQDRLVILQARPLVLQIHTARATTNLPEALKQYPVIFSGKGDIAQRGIGIGKVFVVHGDEDLEDFPAGAILVSKFTSPRFAKVIRKASGIVTDVGSPTGHMATIAREFRVPTIVNTDVATRLLVPGMEITVDADENKVYSARVKELEDFQLLEDPIEETFEYRLLRKVLKIIGVLNLIDPTSREFTPTACRTFHDLIRFVHEKAVDALINRNFRSDCNSTPSGRLNLALPLDLVVIDIDHGLTSRPSAKGVAADQIASVPMQAFVEGLNTPGAWDTAPMAVDFSSFMSSLTRTFSPSLAAPRQIGQNLAVISETYAHISLRLGYHFNMIDATISDDINSNYAYFRFLGGVTDITRRSRRAVLLSEILSQLDFRVDIQGDLVVARIKKLDAVRMREKLRLLGVLVAFSRQLDVQMDNDASVRTYVDKFSQLIHSNHNITTEGGLGYEN